MIATDLKTGTIYKEDGQPYLVVKYQHIKISRGSANVKVKVKNLANGSVLEKGYMSTAKVEDANVERKNAQFLYKDSGFVFMDSHTYEQFNIPEEVIGDSSKFLSEGMTVQVQYFEDNPISIDLPITMVFEVSYTEPGFRGNTVNNVYKPATLSNGAEVKVPSFVKIGDRVKIDTRDGSYVSKA